MTIHHLNCGTLRPPAQLLATGRCSLFRRSTAVCHCLLLDVGDGLALVDTGFGLDQLRDPAAIGVDAVFLRPVPDPALAAVSQVAALGHDPVDVRHLFLTHLDVDHRGGIADFPGAQVHLSAVELDSARRPATAKERARYRGVVDDGTRWSVHTPTGDDWFGFPVLHELPFPGGRVLLVGLAGHTTGHCGVAVETASAAGSRWLLHAGDSFQHHGEIADPPHAPIGVRAFNTVMEADRSRRLRTLEQLRGLARSGVVDIICAHDQAMFDARSGAVAAR